MSQRASPHHRLAAGSGTERPTVTATGSRASAAGCTGSIAGPTRKPTARSHAGSISTTSAARLGAATPRISNRSRTARISSALHEREHPSTGRRPTAGRVIRLTRGTRTGGGQSTGSSAGTASPVARSKPRKWHRTVPGKPPNPAPSEGRKSRPPFPRPSPPCPRLSPHLAFPEQYPGHVSAPSLATGVPGPSSVASTAAPSASRASHRRLWS